MDRVKHYKAIVKKYIQEIAALAPSDEFSETQTILDEERGHYILIDIGWQGKRRTYLPFLHIDVKGDGKVWIQHDGTDLIVAEQLAKNGIPKSDIVLGFHSPSIRPLIEEYGTA